MSTLVETNNSLVFGPQSPIYRIVNDSGVKENFTRYIIDRSSMIYRKRAWNIYKLANNILPGSTLEVNENVKYGIGKLIDSFVTTDFKTIDKLVMNTPRQKYNQGEIALTNELIKATGIKSAIAFVCDTEKESSTNCHAMSVYLTRKVYSGSCDEIIPSWSNKFFSFNDPAQLTMIVAIPKQYLASLIQMVLSASTRELNSSSLDKLTVRGKLIDAFTNDLIKAIFQAIYSDGVRARVTSDILLVNALLQKEGFDSGTKDDFEGMKNYEKHTKFLKQFKRESNLEQIVLEMLERVNEFSATTINPIDFYNTFIDTPNAQFIDLLEKIPQIKKLGIYNPLNSYNFIYSNNLKEMNLFSQERERDCLLYGIKLIRFLPVLYFVIFVLGGGNYQNECRIVVNNVKCIIGHIMSFRAGNAWSTPLVEAIANDLNYLTNDLYNQFASPLNVNTKTVGTLAGAINRYARIDEITKEEIGENA